MSSLHLVCATPDCHKPLRRPNGTADGSQYCATCYSRFLYHRRKATDPDFAEQHNARTRAWQHRNPAKVAACTRRYRTRPENRERVLSWSRTANAKRSAAHSASVQRRTLPLAVDWTAVEAIAEGR